MPEKEIEERIKDELNGMHDALIAPIQGSFPEENYKIVTDEIVENTKNAIMALVNSHYVLKSAVGEAISKLNVYKDFDDDDVVRVSEIKKAVGL